MIDRRIQINDIDFSTNQPAPARRDVKEENEMNNAQQAVRNIESSPICEEDGQCVVHFAENGKCIGTVQVFNGYTKSGWDADVTEDIQFQCEDHAVEQYKAVMIERVRQMLLEQMSPGSSVVVIPIEKRKEMTSDCDEEVYPAERPKEGPND